MSIEFNEQVSQNIHCIIHELLLPLNAIVNSYTVLKDIVPETIADPVSEIGQAGNRLVQEIIELRQHLDERVDLHSPTIAAEQLSDLAVNWTESVAVISHLLAQIRVTNAKLDDMSLDEILNQVLPHVIEKLDQMLSCLMMVQKDHLTSHDNYGGLFVLKHEPDSGSDQL